MSSSSWHEMQSSSRRWSSAAKPWQLWQARASSDVLAEWTETASFWWQSAQRSGVGSPRSPPREIAWQVAAFVA